MARLASLMVCLGLIMGTTVSAPTDLVDPVELTFGVYSSDKTTVMYKTFIPIIRHLQEQTEAELKYLPLSKTKRPGLSR